MPAVQRPSRSRYFYDCRVTGNDFSHAKRAVTPQAFNLPPGRTGGFSFSFIACRGLRAAGLQKLDECLLQIHMKEILTRFTPGGSPPAMVLCPPVANLAHFRCLLFTRKALNLLTTSTQHVAKYALKLQTLSACFCKFAITKLQIDSVGLQ